MLLLVGSCLMYCVMCRFVCWIFECVCFGSYCRLVLRLIAALIFFCIWFIVTIVTFDLVGLLLFCFHGVVLFNCLIFCYTVLGCLFI